MNLQETVRNNLCERDMIRPGDTVICAVSGGADSICMLCLLHEIGMSDTPPGPFAVSCVHVHHAIRGAEADGDAAFVRAFCERLRVPFTLKQVDAPAEAAQTPHASLEEAARHLRYRALAEAAREAGAEDGKRVRIAVAHNMDDDAETVLLNLFRGTGMRGLCGIRPANGLLVRPLLQVARAEIEAFLSERGLQYRTDRTNRDQAYARNRIRSGLLADAKQHINAQAVKHIAQAARDMRQAGAFIDARVDEAHARCKTELPPYLADRQGVKHVLSVRALRKEDAFLRAELLSRLLHEVSASREEKGAVSDSMIPVPPPSSYYQIGRVHIEAVLGLVTSANGRASLDLPGRMRASRIHDFLLISVV